MKHIVYMNTTEYNKSIYVVHRLSLMGKLMWNFSLWFWIEWGEKSVCVAT